MMPIYKLEYITDPYGDGLGIRHHNVSIFKIDDKYEYSIGGGLLELTKDNLIRIIRDIDNSISCHFFSYNNGVKYLSTSPVNRSKCLKRLLRELTINLIVLQ